MINNNSAGPGLFIDFKPASQTAPAPTPNILTFSDIKKSFCSYVQLL